MMDKAFRDRIRDRIAELKLDHQRLFDINKAPSPSDLRKLQEINETITRLEDQLKADTEPEVSSEPRFFSFSMDLDGDD